MVFSYCSVLILLLFSVPLSYFNYYTIFFLLHAIQDSVLQHNGKKCVWETGPHSYVFDIEYISNLERRNNFFQTTTKKMQSLLCQVMSGQPFWSAKLLLLVVSSFFFSLLSMAPNSNIFLWMCSCYLCILVYITTLVNLSFHSVWLCVWYKWMSLF